MDHFSNWNEKKEAMNRLAQALERTTPPYVKIQDNKNVRKQSKPHRLQLILASIKNGLKKLRWHSIYEKENTNKDQ